LRNAFTFAIIADMEAARKTASPGSPRQESDRELALRLGSFMLCSFGSDGGAVIRAIDGSGLNFPQMKVLVALAGETDAEGATVKEISAQVGLSLPSASRTVDDLVKRALATRSEDPNDRRVRRVGLTAEGHEIADELMAARLAGLEQFVGTLNDIERRKLDDALEVLLRRDDIATAYRNHRKRLAG
jgi:DNA-binding MarR family transcriptional regulator